MSKSVADLVQDALNQALIPPQQIGQKSTTAAKIRQANQQDKYKSVADLVQDALNQTLIAPQEVGQGSASAAKMREANRINKPKSVAELVQEVLNQTLAPPQEIGQENATATRARQANRSGMSKSLAERVQEALNQTLIAPQEIGEASTTATRLAEINRIGMTKGIDELVQEALNQTLADPKHSVAQVGKHVNQVIPVMQKMADSLNLVEAKMQGLKASIQGMTKRQPFNEFLREMRQEVMAAVNAIDAIVDQTEFEGNKPLSEEGNPIRITLTDGSYMEVEAGGLGLDALEQDFKTRQDAGAYLGHVQKKLERLQGHRNALVQQLSRLETEVKRVGFQLAHDLGIDPNEINVDLAAEIATLASSEAVSWTMKDALDAQQVHGLLKDPVNQLLLS